MVEGQPHLAVASGGAVVQGGGVFAEGKQVVVLAIGITVQLGYNVRLCLRGRGGDQAVQAGLETVGGGDGEGGG